MLPCFYFIIESKVSILYTVYRNIANADKIGNTIWITKNTWLRNYKMVLILHL